MLAGAIFVSAEVHDRCTLFSSDNIWKRQAVLIEKSLPSGSARKDAKLAELRKGLDKVANSPIYDRCVFERKFEALLVTKGDQKAADKLIAKIMATASNKADGCQPSAQAEEAASRWYTWAGFAAIIIGLAGFVRKEQN